MKKFYLIKFDDKGRKFYAHGRGICGDRRHASLFTDVDFIQWGEAAGYEREELGEDQLLRAAGAAQLPGLEE